MKRKNSSVENMGSRDLNKKNSGKFCVLYFIPLLVDYNGESHLVIPNKLNPLLYIKKKKKFDEEEVS
jgi:hypothetical protein